MWERMFGSRISVIEDVDIKADGRTWLHVSVGAPKNRLPSYEELQVARKAFVGEHREAYMIFPSERSLCQHRQRASFVGMPGRAGRRLAAF